MGYRSDVRIITSKKGYEKLQKHVEKYLKDKKEDYNLLENSDLRYVSSKGVLIGWNSIKWYEWSDYAEVDSIMDGLNKLKDDDYSYRYARIGESYDDIDEEYFDSESREEDYLPYIDILREFGDDYMEAELEDEKKKKTEKDKGVEI